MESDSIDRQSRTMQFQISYLSVCGDSFDELVQDTIFVVVVLVDKRFQLQVPVVKYGLIRSLDGVLFALMFEHALVHVSDYLVQTAVVFALVHAAEFDEASGRSPAYDVVESLVHFEFVGIIEILELVFDIL